MLILVSLVLSPFNLIFYKAAILHTSSYNQLLTGRLLMDAIYYSAFMFLLYLFWFKKNFTSQIKDFVTLPAGLFFMTGVSLTSLLESWLIYKLPISVFTMLGSIAIPAGYVVGWVKYKESFEAKHLIGGFLIVLAIVLFVYKEFI